MGGVAPDARIAGVPEVHRGVQQRAGGEVRARKADAALAHRLLPHAVADGVDAGVVGVGADVGVIFARLGLCKPVIGALCQNQQRSVRGRSVRSSEIVAVPDGAGRRSPGDLYPGELEAVRARVHIGLGGGVLVPAGADGLRIDVQMVHGQHDALAPGADGAVVGAQIEGVVAGTRHPCDVRRHDVAVSVGADGDASAALDAGAGEEGLDRAPAAARQVFQVALADDVGAAVHLKEKEGLLPVRAAAADGAAQPCPQEVQVGKTGIFRLRGLAADDDAVLPLVAVALIVVNRAQQERFAQRAVGQAALEPQPPDRDHVFDLRRVVRLHAACVQISLLAGGECQIVRPVDPGKGQVVHHPARCKLALKDIGGAGVQAPDKGQAVDAAGDIPQRLLGLQAVSAHGRPAVLTVRVIARGAQQRLVLCLCFGAGVVVHGVCLHECRG